MSLSLSETEIFNLFFIPWMFNFIFESSQKLSFPYELTKLRNYLHFLSFYNECLRNFMHESVYYRNKSLLS
jgi:hypothetical protein